MIELVLIPADVETAVSVFELDKANNLTALQQQVDGWIEVARAGPALLIMNEEGRDQRRPINSRATELWAHLLGYDPLAVLHGDVLVAGPNDDHGDFTRCPPVVLQLVGLST